MIHNSLAGSDDKVLSAWMLGAGAAAAEVAEAVAVAVADAEGGAFEYAAANGMGCLAAAEAASFTDDPGGRERKKDRKTARKAEQTEAHQRTR